MKTFWALVVSVTLAYVASQIVDEAKAQSQKSFGFMVHAEAAAELMEIDVTDDKLVIFVKVDEETAWKLQASFPASSPTQLSRKASRGIIIPFVSTGHWCGPLPRPHSIVSIRNVTGKVQDLVIADHDHNTTYAFVDCQKYVLYQKVLQRSSGATWQFDIPNGY